MKFNYAHWSKILDKDEIKKVVNICELNIDPAGDMRYPPLEGEEPVIKIAEVTCTRWEYLNEILNGVYKNWQAANQKIFRYSLYPIQEKTLLNYNVYKSPAKYDFHTDATNDYVSDIKLTGIVNISEEPYEGGEFIVFYDGKFAEIPEIKNPGSSIVLRHGALHKVNPVTKGIRKTLSYWFYGPRFI